MTNPKVYQVAAAGSKDEVLDAFAEALDFPEYFGRNLDALADCLHDFAAASSAPTTVVWAVTAEFKATRAFRLIRQILDEVAARAEEESPKTAVSFVLREQPPAASQRMTQPE